MANYSLLRYPGGKTRAVNILNEFIPKGANEICSPFFGGGSFEIFLMQQGLKIYTYDNFKPLVCFWNAVNNDRSKLISIINSYFPLTKESFYRLQSDFNSFRVETFIGAVYFILNRSSFSGTGLSGGMSPNHPRFTKSSIDRIVDFDFNFDIRQMSFEKSIIKHDCFTFADPPYLINQKLYGNKGDMHTGFDHILLSKILLDKGNFLLTYNNCDEIKDLYPGCNFHYPDWKYGMSKDKNSKEIIITKS